MASCTASGCSYTTKNKNAGVTFHRIFDPKMANHTIDVYYYLMSPPSRAVLMLVKTLGIKHNIKIINVLSGEQMKPEYLKINPLHTIPAIDDGGFILTESNAILKYLSDQYGKDDSLFPKDNKKGAIVNQILSFSATTLFPRVIATHMVYLKGGTVEDEARAKFTEALNYINGLLEESKWIAGSNMTVADIAVISILANVEAAAVYDLTFFPNLWQWFERTKNALAGFEYEEVMQAGATAFGQLIHNAINK